MVLGSEFKSSGREDIVSFNPLLAMCFLSAVLGLDPGLVAEERSIPTNFS
jgi:hypothetical protein